MDFNDIRAVALEYPGVADAVTHGTASLKVGRHFLLREREPGIIAMQCVSMDDRDFILETGGDTFFITDHYKDYPYVLARLKTLDPARFAHLFEAIWRAKALKKHLKAYDAAAR
ncbi:MmcQ/YjbR family DNA-binding protein [Pelagibacterium xiamenense]|uniref:MmcQ/YjbR family DNA-binding protein n=1 Tax=Pelagibacterium xiamenense TaxID=2901140 RepID=UPI001E3FC272|nr:MmcQ/YjbR family DNA-binding protein [Pelagibacterium xiamenense]MCD7060420.1 MmcQ/YjbR family DNA-binding protein [Pelagibacterium xiamenense]